LRKVDNKRIDGEGLWRGHNVYRRKKPISLEGGENWEFRKYSLINGFSYTLMRGTLNRKRRTNMERGFLGEGIWTLPSPFQGNTKSSTPREKGHRKKGGSLFQ